MKQLSFVFIPVSLCILITATTLSANTTSVLTAPPAMNSSCNCKEYIYVNDDAPGEVHKFSIDAATGALTEVSAADGSFPFIVSSNIGGGFDLDRPHGLATDNNGFIYIAESFAGFENHIHKFNSNGELIEGEFIDRADDNPGGIQGYLRLNFSSENGILYEFSANDGNTNNPIGNVAIAWDLCDGTLIGSMNVGADLENSTWGFYDDGENWYIADRGSNGCIYSGSLNTDLYSSPPTNSGSLLFCTGEPNLMGITVDDEENIYVVTNQSRDGDLNSMMIKKYAPDGTELATTVPDTQQGPYNTDGQQGFWGARGLVYSEDSDLIYVGNFDNCITVFDKNLNEQVALNIGNPTSGEAKGVQIAKECCPTANNLSINNSVCYNGTDVDVFLQDLLICEGVIAEGNWMETVDANDVFDFETCNNSVTVRGSGCATYTLNSDGSDANSQCGAFNITVNLCTGSPSFTPSGLQGTCTAGTANNNASVTLTNLVGGDQANISAGASYTGPAYGDASNLDVSLASGSFTGLMHNTTYTVRVWNEANDCFTDETVMTPAIDCSGTPSGGICDCTEFIYLNEPEARAVLKFAVNEDSTLTEIKGGANQDKYWYPGDNVSELSSPHGLGTDLNGFLYIGETITGDVRRLTCDGAIFSEPEFVLNSGGSNYGSIGNALYSNTLLPTGRGLRKYDLCTGDLVGEAIYCVTVPNSWGFYVDPRTEIMYATAAPSGDNHFFIFDDSDFDLDPNTCIDPIDLGPNFPVSNVDLRGTVTDADGNIYMAIQDDFNMSPAGSYIIKFGPAPTYTYLGMSAVDNAQDGVGYALIIGLIYSETTNLIYASTVSDIDQCIAVFDTDLNYYPNLGVPSPGTGVNAKGIAITKECCPTPLTQTINQTFCEAAVGDKLFLNELFPCEGIVCGAEWSPDTGNTGMTYDPCDQSITITTAQACGIFTKSGTNNQCGTYDLTYNLNVIDIGTVSISPDQMICAGDIPAQLSLTTTSSGTIQWQMSTSSCTTDFTDIPSANALTYQPAALSETTYYRALINESGSCSSGSCILESNCITVSVTSLSANESSELCNDNDTPSDITDDYITFSLNPSGVNLGSSYSLSVDNGATVTRESGAAATGILYGATTSFRLQNGSADGTTTFTITINDDGTNACSGTTSLMQNSCGPCVSPAFTAMAQEGTCLLSAANNDAVINLTNITNGEEAGISPGSSYTGAAFGSPSNVTINSGSLSFSDLQHNTQYTVRIYNTDSSCFTDQTLTTPDITCLVYYSLGNRVFYDDDLNGIQNDAEAGIDGVQLQLLNADGTIYDSDNTTPGSQALIVTTAGGGYYRFDNLPAGNYIVEILPDAFSSSSVLENYLSTQGAGQEANPNLDADMNDNGLDSPLPGTVRSGIITLEDIEPTGETEPVTYLTGSFSGTAAADTESNLTVDFGFYRQRDRPDFEDPMQSPCPEEPCHFISNDIYLGTGVTNDATPGGSPTADNDADDGLLWGENVNASPGGTLNLPIALYNNTGNDAYLRIWVDWNADGDFEDTNEQVADELYLSAVYNGAFQIHLPVVIPTEAAQNQDIALRLRLSTDNSNTADPCGNGTCAADGEIEDFLLRLTCPQAVCLPVITLIRN